MGGGWWGQASTVQNERNLLFLQPTTGLRAKFDPIISPPTYVDVNNVHRPWFLSHKLLFSSIEPSSTLPMSQIPSVHAPAELQYRRDRVRLTVLIFRKEGMSTENFQQYWRNEHSQCFAHLKIVKKNLLKYEQVGVMIAKIVATAGPNSPFVLPVPICMFGIEDIVAPIALNASKKSKGIVLVG